MSLRALIIVLVILFVVSVLIIEWRDKDDKTDTEECCAICFEVPSTYGLLTNCDHVFCLCRCLSLVLHIFIWPKKLSTGGTLQGLGFSTETMRKIILMIHPV